MCDLHILIQQTEKQRQTETDREAMASSSFNSSFPSNHHHKKHWKKIGLGGSIVAIAVAAAAAGATSAQLINKDCSKRNPLWMQCSSGSSGFSPFASLSHHSQSLASSFTEPRTGVSFPTSIVAGDDEGKSEDLHLAGTGLRKKNILGLKNITVYAFGKNKINSLKSFFVFFVFVLWIFMEFFCVIFLVALYMVYVDLVSFIEMALS